MSGEFSARSASMDTAITRQLISRAARLRTGRAHIAAFHDAANDLIRDFPSEDACLEFIKEIRWANGMIQCVKCGRERKHHRVTGRKAYACDRCGNHVYPLRGTVFARSSTSLQKWFYTICLLASANRRITATRIQRETGVTYKTAWRMLRQLRFVIAACEPQWARFAEEAIVVSEPTKLQGRQVEPLAPGARSQSRVSCNVTCLEGITFIVHFFPAYLRMCRDV